MADFNITNQTGMVHTDIPLLGSAASSQAGHNNVADLSPYSSPPNSPNTEEDTNTAVDVDLDNIIVEEIDDDVSNSTLIESSEYSESTQEFLEKMNLLESSLTNHPAELETSTNDKDTKTVNQLIEVAKKAAAANDYKKAHYILSGAKSIKPTNEIDRELKHVNECLQKQQYEISEKITELAMTAINNDDFDVAEMLLKTASIQYNDKSAEKILSTFDLNSHRTKTIECKDKNERSDTYVIIAQDLISKGLLKAAESILIIAGYTSATYAGFWNYKYSSITKELLHKVQKHLYPNVVLSDRWILTRHDNFDSNDEEYAEENLLEMEFKQFDSSVTFVRELNPTCDVITYKCYYYIHMAFVAFKCADDIQLALKFLEEADTIYPDNKDVQKYIGIVENQLKLQDKLR